MHHFVSCALDFVLQIAQIVNALEEVRRGLYAALDNALLPDEIISMPSEKKKSMKKLLKEQINNGTVHLDNRDAANRKVRVEREFQAWPSQPAATPEGLLDTPAAPADESQGTFGVKDQHIESTVTSMHMEAQTAYDFGCKWFDEQLQSWSQKIAQQRHKETDLVKVAQQRWALAVTTLKEPFRLQ